jgi:hypothetical protein
MDDYRYVPVPTRYPADLVSRFIVEQTGDTWVAYSPELSTVVEPQWGNTGVEALQNLLLTVYRTRGQRAPSANSD